MPQTLQHLWVAVLELMMLKQADSFSPAVVAVVEYSIQWRLSDVTHFEA